MAIQFYVDLVNVKMLLIKLLIFYFIYYYVDARSATTRDAEKIVTEISTGQIRGKKFLTVEKGKPYYSFRGIPYAEAPLGYLRFEPPQPQRKWNGILDTIQEGASCIQAGNPLPIGDEDCLFVNVYTTQYPSSKPSRQDKLLPVMVWIYGGGFTGGSSKYELYGPDYFLDQDVVIVSINYRLGIFGFLTTGDMVVPGNNGLKDQVLALKWVRDNIRVFGGDPNKVTIFGQSAGSASVSYLLQSNLTKGLFHGTIMESGVSLCLWTFSRHNLEITKSLAKELKIDSKNATALVQSLRRFNATYLHQKSSGAAAAQYLKNTAREGFIFAPVIEPEHDGAFLTEKSHVKLSRGDFHKVPCIVGYNSLEGTFDIFGLLRLILAKWDIEPNTLVPYSLNINSFLKRTEAAFKIKYHYFGLMPAALANVKVMKFIGDDQFVRPIREFVKLVSKHTKLFYYRFSYEGGMWECHLNKTRTGVSHSAELGYMWRSNCTPSNDDLVKRKQMIKLWTNFAKTGSPTSTVADSQLDNINWRTANSERNGDLVYLNIDKTLNVTVNPDNDDMRLWDDVFRKFGNPPYDTY